MMNIYCQCGELYSPTKDAQLWRRLVGFCSAGCLREYLRLFIPGELYCKGFPRKFRGATLHQLISRTQRESRIDEDLRRRLERKPKRGLFVHGPVGVGKTFRAVAVAAECSLFSMSICYSNTEDYITSCQKSFQNKESPSDVRDELLADDLLVLDDLGAQRLTDFGLAQVDALIDKAYRNERPILIVTSNKSLNELADEVPRTADRIAELCDVVKLDGATRRLKQDECKGGYWLFYRRPRLPWEKESAGRWPVGVTYRRNALWRLAERNPGEKDDAFDRKWVEV
jgi:hypothetical protein